MYDPDFEALIDQVLERTDEGADRDDRWRPSLRVARAIEYLTGGYTASVEEILDNALFDDAAGEMVLVKDIEFYSLSEQTMLPFFGTAHVAYLPNEKIIALNKITHLVEAFARRLQMQERLTHQIADTLGEVLDPHGVAVVLKGCHFRMMMGDIQKQNGTTITSTLRGAFNEDARTRSEFLQLVR